MKKFVSIFFFLSLLFPAFSQSSIYPVLTADSTTVRLGEPVNVTLSLIVKDDLSKYGIQWPDIQDTFTNKVIVLEKGKIDTSESSNGITRLFQKVSVTAYDTGTYVLNFPFIINNQEVSSNDITFQINTIPIDTSAGFKDIHEVIDIPMTVWDWIKENALIIGGVLFAILVTFYFYLKYRRRKKNPVTESAPILPSIDPAEKALSQLHQYKLEKIWENQEPKEYYTLLINVVREYLEKAWHINAFESTSSELSQWIKNNDWNLQDKNELIEILEMADMSKFAKKQPSSEDMENSVNGAIIWVQNTRALIENRSEDESVKK